MMMIVCRFYQNPRLLNEKAPQPVWCTYCCCFVSHINLFYCVVCMYASCNV